MFNRLIARVLHFGKPVPGKNSPILWIDKKKCPYMRGRPNTDCRGIPRSTANKRVKKYQADVNAQARICQGPRKPTSKLVRVDGTVYVGDIVRRDTTNMLESIFDALEKVVYEDDFQIHEIHVKRRLDHKMPRIEFEFHEIEDPDFDAAREKAAKNRQKGWRTKDREKTGQAELGLVRSRQDDKGAS